MNDMVRCDYCNNCESEDGDIIYRLVQWNSDIHGGEEAICVDCLRKLKYGE